MGEVAQKFVDANAHSILEINFKANSASPLKRTEDTQE
jgi:hypothetical protein